MKTVSILKSVIYTGIITLAAILLLGALKKSKVDSTWIVDLGFEKGEINKLSFNWFGSRGCPIIPLKTAKAEFGIIFDTGCGTGISFTNLVEDKLDFTLIKNIESLNRDGSHRGWSKQVVVNYVNIFGDVFENVNTVISDWKMFSNRKFNGLVGLEFFQNKIVTLDYAGKRIAVSNKPIDYERLDTRKFIVLPLFTTSSPGQEFLPFFEAELNYQPVMVYLDTGKNHSYVLNKQSAQSIQQKPKEFVDVPLKVGDYHLMLKDVVEVFDIASADGLPFPTGVELNSDQIWKLGLLVTFDLIENKIIIRP